MRRCVEKDRENSIPFGKDIGFALAEASGPAASASALRSKRHPGPTGSRSRSPSRPSRRTGRRGGAPAAAAPAGRGVAARADVKRVAVLPFENLGAPEDDYFADGVADAVRGKLTRFRESG